MDSLNLNKHISGQFNAELESIRTQVMTMGGMVEQQLSDAITAMHNQDSDLAKRVIEGDKNVNMMEVASLRAHYRQTSADGERPATGYGDQ